MCIYCGTNRYRKIYENHYGEIPKDETGRSYEIHHIDGNHSNNNPENLKVVTIQEHYNLHYTQGDYGACYAIGVRMKKTTEELSDIARKVAYKKIADGTHPLLNPIVQQKGVEAAKIINDQRIANGTHNFQGGKIQSDTHRRRVNEGTHHFLGSEINRKRIENGTHNLLGGALTRKQLENGTHSSQIKKVCEHCNKKISTTNYSRWHGAKCKAKKTD